MYPMLLTLNLDDDQAVAVCRLLRQHQTILMAEGRVEEAKPFVDVAHEIAEAVMVRREKLADEVA